MSDRFDREDLMIKKVFSKVQPEREPELLSEILAGVQKPSARPRVKLALILCAILLLTSFTAFALGHPSFMELFTRFDDEFLELYQPVELSCEEQGIRMEVTALLCQDNQMMAYITLEDLEEDRLKDGILYNFSSLSVETEPFHVGSDSFQLAHADEETGILTFLYQAYGFDVKGIEEATFSFRDIYAGPVAFTQADTGVNPADAPASPETVSVPLNELFSYGYRGDLPETITLLRPYSDEHDIPGVNSHWISSMGFIEEKLHVQVHTSSYYLGDFAFYLYDKRGNQIPYEQLFYFDMSGSEENRGILEEWCLQEWVFDASPEDLKGGSLLMDFTETERITGLWSVTTPIVETSEESTDIPCLLPLDQFTVNTIEITPLNVTLVGDNPDFFWIAETTGYHGIAVEVETVNGSLFPTFLFASEEMSDGELLFVTVNGGIIGTEMGSGFFHNDTATPGDTLTKVIFSSLKPLDVEEITAIIVNGHRVEMPH